MRYNITYLLACNILDDSNLDYFHNVFDYFEIVHFVCYE